MISSSSSRAYDIVQPSDSSSLLSKEQWHTLKELFQQTHKDAKKAAEAILKAENSNIAVATFIHRNVPLIGTSKSHRSKYFIF